MPRTDPQENLIAVLSAANATADIVSKDLVGEPVQVVGYCVLELQLMALKRAGCSSFIIEVDNVSGWLLEVVDRFRRDGFSVEFARNINDLQNYVRPGTRLLIQAEDQYYSDEVICNLTANDAPFIATFDSREENADFERIDLNTRWAGFASINSDIVHKMKEVPDDWGIVPSLLRQAVQEKVVFWMMPQVYLQNKEVAKINSRAKAMELSLHILDTRSKIPSGWVERTVYAPLARLLVPKIWAIPNMLSLCGVSGIIFAAISLAFAFCGLPLFALLGALAGLFCNYLSSVVQDFASGRRTRIWSEGAFWLILVGAGIVTANSQSNFGSDIIWFAVVMIGLGIVARKVILPHWIKALLMSPSLIVIFLIFAVSMSMLSLVIKALVIAQIVLLVIGQYVPEGKHVKND